MIENSFIHLPGIGPETEKRLWSLGFTNWDELSDRAGEVFGAKKASKVCSAIDESRAAFEGGELAYFQKLLKGADMWRLVPALLKQGHGDRIAYLDIETTGLGFPPQSDSTTIAVMFDGKLEVEHDPKKKHQLLKKIEEEAKLFVTFNGISFDMPFLRREFDLELAAPHLDLRFWFARLGRRGGLKAIQKSFPEVHQRVSMDIDGFDAVRLWRMHEYGVKNALETLMTYNAEDTIVLEQLLFCGLNIEAESRKELKLQNYDLPKAPWISTQVCPQVYKLLRS